MPTSRFVAVSALALAFAGAACGSLSGDTGSPSTLTTIHGTIVTSDATAAPPASLSTAIIWFEAAADGTVREAAYSVPVSGSFPLDFSMNVTSPPPASALIDIGADPSNPIITGVHFAVGYVVAYDDLNGNGQLDLVDASASQYADAIEGVADREIFYLDKALPASFPTTYLTTGIDGATAQVGYNLLDLRPNYCFAQTDAGAAGTCLSGWLWEPMSTSVTLAIGTSQFAPTPEVEQELMCASGPNNDNQFTLDENCGSGPCAPTISAAAFRGAFPSAGDPNVTCDDLQNFTYTSSCTTSVAGFCQAVGTVCTQQNVVSLNPGGGSPLAPPAGWPCAEQPAPSPSFLNWLAAHSSSSSGGGGGGNSGSSGGGSISADAGAPST